ncbi:hypothetical protein [Streptomyces sp. NPDC086787]|uniref:hypothetical protein n=1 Tax=Streptomyces sp. NPDC086787 TaxID=3365759 RepID=UPI00382B3AC4
MAVGAAFVALALGGTAAYAAGSHGPASGAVPVAMSSSSSASPSPDHGQGRGHGFFGLRGLDGHGEATVKDRDTGKWVVRVWQRGTVEKVDGDQVTVASGDGAKWTWTVGPDTKVRGKESNESSDALKKGDTALLAGTRTADGTRTAKFAAAGAFDRAGGHHRDGRGCSPDHAPSPKPSDSGATT